MLFPKTINKYTNLNIKNKYIYILFQPVLYLFEWVSKALNNYHLASLADYTRVLFLYIDKQSASQMEALQAIGKPINEKQQIEVILCHSPGNLTFLWFNCS